MEGSLALIGSHVLNQLSETTAVNKAQKLEQLRVRAHAASVSLRRKRTSFQIIYDVLHVPAPQLDISATAYGLPFSPQSPNDQSTHQLGSTGAICASFSA